jgi:hypothetical protein
MLTFLDQLNIARKTAGVSDVTTVAALKRDINAGTARFLAKLDRPITRQSRFTNIVANQQYYQIPEDAIRVTKAKVANSNNNWRSMTEVPDEETWINLNSNNQTGDPTSFFVKGADEVGLYPIPSQAVTSGFELVYEPKHVLLTADDYTTGTISATNGSNAIVGVGTTFTAKMASGLYVLQITDGSDGNYYKITGYTDATHITLENYYQGITGSLLAYRIGQVSRIPEEYQEAPVDYALFRYFLGEGEDKKAVLHKSLWENSLKDAEDVYGKSTSNQIIHASGEARPFNPLTDITSNQIQV